MSKHKFSFYEFFAGGGMARAGLGENWECIFANDFDGKKALSYQRNWGTDGELVVEDIHNLVSKNLPNSVDLSWGSFPCQDLSLAGGGAGLKGNKSGTFFPFWDLMAGLKLDGRAPKLIVLENVCGTLTSHGGEDFNSISDTFSKTGYRFGALVIDASLFIPHSRPRLFFLGVRKDIEIPSKLTLPGPDGPFYTSSLLRVVDSLKNATKDDWLWWNLPQPSLPISTLSDLIEPVPSSVEWHDSDQTNKILSMMAPLHKAKVETAKRLGHPVIGSIYKRTRSENGIGVVRAEVRFDGISGCLRTPNGGSSRQIIIVVDGKRIKTRLLSVREAARLMGLSDAYKLPTNYNEAYHLMGDGVVVPVVRYISEHILETLLSQVPIDVPLFGSQQKTRIA